jgi:arsenate reductase-like glutaredoxin family protein
LNPAHERNPGKRDRQASGRRGNEDKQRGKKKLKVRHPDLIQRPIVEKGNKAILARPAERIKDFL